jgi:hypothetical protein
MTRVFAYAKEEPALTDRERIVWWKIRAAPDSNYTPDSPYGFGETPLSVSRKVPAPYGAGTN